MSGSKEIEKRIEELRKEREGLVTTIRELKQKLGTQPSKIIVRG